MDEPTTRSSHEGDRLSVERPLRVEVAPALAFSPPVPRPSSARPSAPVPRPRDGASRASSRPNRQPWPVRPYRVAFLEHRTRSSDDTETLLRLLGSLRGAVDAHVILAGDRLPVDAWEQVGASVEVLPASPRDLATLYRRLRALRPDLVHARSLESALHGGAASRLAGIPLVWQVPEDTRADHLPGAATRLTQAGAMVLARAVVTDLSGPDPSQRLLEVYHQVLHPRR